MSYSEEITDDHVRAVLLKEAKELEKSRLVGSQLSTTRPSNALKPNARFLNSIIRSTDSHNAALKSRRSGDESRSPKRKREDDKSDVGNSRKERRRKYHESSRAKHNRDSRDRRNRSRSPRRDRDYNKRHHVSSDAKHSRDSKNRRDRSRSPRRDRDFDETCSDRHRENDGIDKRSKCPIARKYSATQDQYTEDDSDPLDDMIGPRPAFTAPTYERDAQNHSSIDDHFRPDYDPKTDIDIGAEDEGVEWDTALQSIRDRAKWQKSRAERMRAAGFKEQDITNWESRSVAKDSGEDAMMDHKWTKKGEVREWDRGKVADGKSFDVRPSWMKGGSE